MPNSSIHFRGGTHVKAVIVQPRDNAGHVMFILCGREVNKKLKQGSHLNEKKFDTQCRQMNATAGHSFPDPLAYLSVEVGLKFLHTRLQGLFLYVLVDVGRPCLVSVKANDLAFACVKASCETL